MLNHLISLLSIVSLLTAIIATTSDPVCVHECSKWSIVLGHCRGVYGNTPMYISYAFANDFVGSLCKGETNDEPYGNETIQEAAGICESCKTTQRLIRKNLSDFLELCAIQKANGTAAGALTYRPISYSTSEAAIGRPVGDLGLSGSKRRIDDVGWVWGVSLTLFALSASVSAVNV